MAASSNDADRRAVLGRAKVRRHFLAYLSGPIGALVVSVLVARELGAAAFGAFAVLSATASVLSYLLGANSLVGAYRYHASHGVLSARGRLDSDAAPPGQVLGSALVLSSLSAVCCAAVVWVFASPAARILTGDEGNGWAVVSVCALALLMAAWRPLSNCLRLDLRVAAHNGFTIVRALVVSVATLAGLVVFGDLLGLMLGLTVGQGLMTLALAWRVRQNLSFDVSPAGAALAVGRGWPILPASLGMALLFSVNGYMLLGLAAPATVGVFFAAHRLGQGVQVLHGAFRLALMPIERASQIADTATAVDRESEYSRNIIRVVAAAGIVSLLAPYLEVVYGAGFADAEAIVPLIAYGAVALSLHHLLLAGARIGSVLRLHTIAVYLALGVTVVGGAVLIPAHGVLGAGVAGLIGMGTLVASGFLMIRRAGGVTRLHARPMLLAFALTAAPFVALAAVPGGTGDDPALRLVACAVVVGAGFLILRTLPLSRRDHEQHESLDLVSET